MKSLRVKSCGLLVAFFCITSALVNANDVNISGVEVENIENDMAKVKFSITWDNSWRENGENANWDAVWVFIKVRTSESQSYTHLYPEFDGHTFPISMELIPGLINTTEEFDAANNPVVGVFIQRSLSKIGSGSVEFSDIEILIDRSKNNLLSTDYEISIHAIEMVYVPQGTFYAGSSGEEEGHFVSGGTADPFLVTEDWDKTVANQTGSIWGTSEEGTSSIGESGSLNDDFPTGFEAFYSMKYEVSQDQYATFLNSISYSSQLIRTAQSPESNVGTFVMTTDLTTSRNGIQILNSGESPATNAGYESTSPYVAANFLDWSDAAAYLDWSGLRPMTELEYEKAAKEPVNPLPNQFVWGTTSIFDADYILANESQTDETVSNAPSDGTTGNALYGSTSGNTEGPVRVGIFANQASSRAEAGAGFWGIMELSGNLREQVVNISTTEGRAYSGLHGSGELSANGEADVQNWPGIDGVGSGSRGGGWNDPAAILQTSDRSFSSLESEERSSNTGVRGVRTLPLSNAPKLTFIIIDDDSTRKETDSTVVQSDPPGIDCRRVGLVSSGTCSYEFEPETEVKLDIWSNIPDSEFQIDDGELITQGLFFGPNISEPTNITMRVLDGNDRVESQLKIFGTGFNDSFYGSISSVPSGINCSTASNGSVNQIFPQCVFSFPRNTQVTFNGASEDGYELTGFNFNDESFEQTTSVSLNLQSDTQINAFFRSNLSFPQISNWEPIELGGVPTPVTGEITDTDTYLVGGYIMIGASGHFENRTMLFQNDDLTRIVAMPEVVTAVDLNGVSADQGSGVASIASAQGLYECPFDPVVSPCQFIPIDSEDPDRILNLKDVLHTSEGRLLLEAGDAFRVWEENESGWQENVIPFSTSGFTQGRLFHTEDDHIIVQGSRAFLEYDGVEWAYRNIANVNISGVTGTTSDNLFFPFATSGIVGSYRWDGMSAEIVYLSNQNVDFDNVNPSMMMVPTTAGTEFGCGSEGDQHMLVLTGVTPDSDTENHGIIANSCDNGMNWQTVELENRGKLVQIKDDGSTAVLVSPTVEENETGDGSEIVEQTRNLEFEGYGLEQVGANLLHVIEGLPSESEIEFRSLDLTRNPDSNPNKVSFLNSATSQIRSNETLSSTLYASSINGIVQRISTDLSTGYLPFNDSGGDPHPITSIWGASETEAYAVTDSPILFHGSNLIAGLILQFKDSVWSEMPNPARDSKTLLYNIEGSSPDDIYAIGEKGTILHFDGVEWDSVDAGLQGNEELSSIWVGAENQVFIAGHREFAALLLHFDGASWNEFPLSPHIAFDTPLPIFGDNLNPIRDIWATGFGNIWVVSRFGDVANWNGVEWIEYPGLLDNLEFGYNDDNLRITGSGSNDVYLLAPAEYFGDPSSVFNFDGEVWNVIYETNDENVYLRDIIGSRDGSVYISGSNGTILQAERD